MRITGLICPCGCHSIMKHNPTERSKDPGEFQCLSTSRDSNLCLSVGTIRRPLVSRIVKEFGVWGRRSSGLCKRTFA